MKIKSFIAKNISRVLFFVLFLADGAFAFYSTGNYENALLFVLLVCVVAEIQFLVSMFMLKAHSFKNSMASDAALLEQCMNDIMAKAGKKRKIGLYISDNDSMKVHAVGGSIIVDRGLLATRDTMMIKSVLSHKVSHILNDDSVFFPVLRLHLALALLIFTGTMLGAVFAAGLVFFLGFWCAGSFFAGVFFGRKVKELARGLADIFIKIFSFLSNIALKIFTFAQEHEADRFAVSLGYASGLKNYLESNTEHKSWAETLLGENHASNTRRLVRIEKAENYFRNQNTNTNFQNLFV